MEIIEYIPAPSWLVSDFLRPAAYGALAGIVINCIVRWM